MHNSYRDEFASRLLKTKTTYWCPLPQPIACQHDNMNKCLHFHYPLDQCWCNEDAGDEVLTTTTTTTLMMLMMIMMLMTMVDDNMTSEHAVLLQEPGERKRRKRQRGTVQRHVLNAMCLQ
eukprot:4182866-Amphidinium_carterae.1